MEKIGYNEKEAKGEYFIRKYPEFCRGLEKTARARGIDNMWIVVTVALDRLEASWEKMSEYEKRRYYPPIKRKSEDIPFCFR